MTPTTPAVDDHEIKQDVEVHLPFDLPELHVTLLTGSVLHLGYDSDVVRCLHSRTRTYPYPNRLVDPSLGIHYWLSSTVNRQTDVGTPSNGDHETSSGPVTQPRGVQLPPVIPTRSVSPS